jgi:hypothetical protein
VLVSVETENYLLPFLRMVLEPARVFEKVLTQGVRGSFCSGVAGFGGGLCWFLQLLPYGQYGRVP